MKYLNDYFYVLGYIFENIPGGVFNDIVRVCLSIELTLTFPIVFKPASDVMEEIIQGVLLVLGYTHQIIALLLIYYCSILQKLNVSIRYLKCMGRG